MLYITVKRFCRDNITFSHLFLQEIARHSAQAIRWPHAGGVVQRVHALPLSLLPAFRLQAKRRLCQCLDTCRNPQNEGPATWRSDYKLLPEPEIHTESVSCDTIYPLFMNFVFSLQSSIFTCANCSAEEKGIFTVHTAQGQL